MCFHQFTTRLNVLPNAITRPPLNQKQWKQMNYTFVTKTTSQLRISPLYFFLSLSLSPSQAQGGKKKKVESFLIKFQADVALGDA